MLRLIGCALLFGLPSFACGGPPCVPQARDLEYRWQVVVIDATDDYSDVEWSAGFGINIAVRFGEDTFLVFDLDDALLAYENEGDFVWPRPPNERSERYPVVHYNQWDSDGGCRLWEDAVFLQAFEVLAYTGNATVNREESGGREFEIDDDYHRLYELTLRIDPSEATCDEPPPTFEVTLRAELTSHDVFGTGSNGCEEE